MFVDRDGIRWLRTGDVALIDAQGFVRIVDRLKDMILSGGVNVYPKDIEDAIYTLPEIDDVAGATGGVAARSLPSW